MARTLQITIASDHTDAFLDVLQAMPEVVSLAVFRGASEKPPGNIVSVTIPNDAHAELMRQCDEFGVGVEEGSSLVTSEPTSVISSAFASRMPRERGDASWEEMEMMIAKESNMAGSMMLVMFLAGVMATIGLATNALHIVVAAMLLAPGFEPIVRVALGITAGSDAWRRGLRDTFLGYGLLAAGAFLTTLVLQLLGRAPLLGDEASYLPIGVLIPYWTSVSFSSVLVLLAAGTTGAIVVATNRSVLTAGVMVALALVPTATITAIALASGTFDVALEALLRWVVEVTGVIVMSLLVFAWKRMKVHRRAMIL